MIPLEGVSYKVAPDLRGEIPRFDKEDMWDPVVFGDSYVLSSRYKIVSAGFSSAEVVVGPYVIVLARVYNFFFW